MLGMVYGVGDQAPLPLREPGSLGQQRHGRTSDLHNPYGSKHYKKYLFWGLKYINMTYFELFSAPQMS